MKRFVVVSSLLVLGLACFAQDPAASPGPYKVPDDLMGKKNPVTPTLASLAHAKKMWGYDCAICHGATGDGKGDLASSMKPPMKDYTDPATLQGMSDGELFYIIQKGNGQMPSEGDRAKPDDIWNMVALVRSFSKK
jgi:mono/diheme cytochrome c family protein